MRRVVLITLALIAAGGAVAVAGSTSDGSPDLVSAVVTAPARPTLSIKGFVTARTPQTLMVTRGDGTRILVSVTLATRVTGQRTAFAAIAVNDIVRVDGTVMSARAVVARQIEVILAGTTGVAQSRPAGIPEFIWNWIKNGGPTIPLP